MEKYKKKGYIAQAVGGFILTIVGVGVGTLITIYVSVLAGQTYQLSESKIDAITNATVRDAVKGASVAGFQTLKQTSEQSSLVALAIMVFLVLSLVLGSLAMFGMGGGGFGGRGSAL